MGNKFKANAMRTADFWGERRRREFKILIPPTDTQIKRQIRRKEG